MWKRIGSFLILGVFLICCAAVTFAREAEVSISVSQKEVLLGDSVILTITVKGIPNPETPELPDIPGFDVKFRGFRQESFSSMTIIVNGRQVKNERTGGGYNFDFELIPQSTGVLTVPPLPIVINGTKYTTQAFQVNVLDQSEKREDIFIDVHFDKTKAYLGEKFLATFKWYFSKDIANYRINIPWLENIKDFLVTDPELDKDRSYQRLIVNGDKQIAAIKSREFYKGQEYMVVSFQKVLTPLAAGIYRLEPVFLKCDVITGYRRSRRGSLFDSFFDSDFEDFFGFGRDAVTEPFATRSNEIALTVNEVPGQDKPVEYNGAVGRFTFDVDVKPRSLKVGEPITLTMKVAGSGNIEQLQLPHIPDIESFKSYEPESKVNITQENGQVRGEKIFEKVLIPRSPGDYKIPEITFAFFNPATGRYQTEVRGPFSIHVDKAEKEEEVTVIAITPEGPEDRPRRELKVLKKGIHYIMTDIGKIVSPKKPIYENIVLSLLVFLTPVIMLVGMFVFGRRRERLNTDIAFARSRQAFKSSRIFIKQAELALKNGQTREFYDLLIKGINTYLAEKLNRQLGSVGVTLAEELRGKGLKEKECEEFTSLYEKANEVIFSSLNVESEKLKKDFKTANELITRLERILR
ncbi:MAG: hypothetical protein DRP74_02335 [Candidatus Omnitrophota bacterium]|nr:MAG: hypothetical protein DRP74_02335 [Candidatus Omnitrophota bacterium]